MRKTTLTGEGKASPMFFVIVITIPPYCRARVGRLLLSLAQRPGFAFLLY